VSGCLAFASSASDQALGAAALARHRSTQINEPGTLPGLRRHHFPFRIGSFHFSQDPISDQQQVIQNGILDACEKCFCAITNIFPFASPERPSDVRARRFSSRSRHFSHIGCDRIQQLQRPSASVIDGRSDFSIGLRAALTSIQSFSTTLSRDLSTWISPLYRMKPSFRNLFMKTFTRDRVVPIISASISCETLGSTV
jgi:hypothetical protein